MAVESRSHPKARQSARAACRKLALLAGGLGCTTATAAQAQAISEVRFGVLAHDVANLGAGQKDVNSADLQIEVLSGRPRVLRWLGGPRVIGTYALNSAGETSGGSVGLAWDHRLFSRRLVGEFTLGPAYSDGVRDAPAGPAGAELRAHRLLIGSHYLFRESLGLDWRMTPRWAIGITFAHFSNGSLLGEGPNESENSLGLRVGYRFH